MATRLYFVINIGTGDTVGFTVPAGEKYKVTAANSLNDTGASVNYDAYNSPDDTSASGDKVASDLYLAAGDSSPLSEILGQSYTAGRRLILVATAVGINLSITYTKYTGDDV